jgi:hypothetical protein
VESISGGLQELIGRRHGSIGGGGTRFGSVSLRLDVMASFCRYVDEVGEGTTFGHPPPLRRWWGGSCPGLWDGQIVRDGSRWRGESVAVEKKAIAMKKGAAVLMTVAWRDGILSLAWRMMRWRDRRLSCCLSGSACWLIRGENPLVIPPALGALWRSLLCCLGAWRMDSAGMRPAVA